jgi:hypothetical protein
MDEPNSARTTEIATAYRRAARFTECPGSIISFLLWRDQRSDVVKIDTARGSKVYDLAWNIYSELRKEILELVELRAKLISAKITFVSAAITIIIGTIEKPYPKWIIVIPPVASICFDFIINSCIIISKKIDLYLRSQIEPILCTEAGFPSDVRLWSGYSWSIKVAPLYFPLGNIGVTACFILIAICVVLVYESFLVSMFCITVLLILFALDILSLYVPASRLGFAAGEHFRSALGDLPLQAETTLIAAKARLTKVSRKLP